MPDETLTVKYNIETLYTFLKRKEGEYKIRVVYDPEGEEALSPDVFGAKATSPFVKLKVIGSDENYTSLEELTEEIDSPVFNSKLFADIVIFELNDQVIKATKEKEKKENWEKVKAIFRKRSGLIMGNYNIQSDIIDPYDKTHKKAVKQTGLEKYYQYILRGQYHYTYLIGLNKQGKIALVQELMYHYPASLPPVPEE